MDETQALNLAVDAYAALQGIREDVAQLKGINSDVLALLTDRTEVPAPDVPDISLYGLEGGSVGDGQWHTTVTSETEVPAAFFTDVMGFQYMQTVLFVFMLLALLLNLGATLWLSFSDKWRS